MIHVTEHCSDTWGERASPHADSTSRWGTPWWAGHLSAERCEWCRQWPESAPQPLWVYEWRWRPPLSLVVPPPVTCDKWWAGTCSIFPPSLMNLHISHLWSRWGCWKAVLAAPPAPCPTGRAAEAAVGSLQGPGRRWRSLGRTWTCRFGNSKMSAGMLSAGKQEACSFTHQK